MSSTVESLLDEGLERNFFAGAAAIVAAEDGLLLEVYAGAARTVPASASVEAGTLWDLASLTKPIAGAALVLGLAGDRSLSLDDPLSRFDDLYKKMKFEGVTLRSLLTHTAGVAAWFPCYVRGEGRSAYRKTLADLDAAAIPGSTVIYSCLGYLLLADVVERVAGNLDRLFQARVTAPLGLEKDLLFRPEGADQDRAAGGETDDATERALVVARKLRYVGFRSGVVNGEVNDGNAYRRAGGVSLNAGLFGTARAVAAVGQAWLRRDPRLLPEASSALAVANATPLLNEHRGLGWQMASSPDSAGSTLPAAAFGHTGFTGSSLFVDPDARRVFVLLTNKLHPVARAVDMDAFRRRFHELAREG